MSEVLITKLLDSFNELEKCIVYTKDVLAQKEGVSEDVLQRVNQYFEIVNKQRSLTEELRAHMQSQNWDEVSRHIKIINGLSSMIKEDAQSILTATIQTGDPSKPKTEDTLV